MPLTRNIIIHSQQSHHQNDKIIYPSSDLLVVPGYFMLYVGQLLPLVRTKRRSKAFDIRYFLGIFLQIFLCCYYVLYVESVRFR